MTAPAPAGDGAILVVYPFCLDHVGHGNIQRILAIARYLAAQGHAVDLVYQGSPRVPRVEEQYRAFRRVIAVEGGAASGEEAACAARLEAFYSGRELPPMHMRPSAPLTTFVRALIEAEPYRAVVATYAFTAPIFAGLQRRVFTICDVQDVMHEHAEACARATGQASSFTMPADTEAFLWRQWDALVAITPEDEARIARDLAPGQHLISARHASRCATAAAPGADDVALYAASDNQSNVQAAVWLLEAVWPRVRRARPQARLRMAGLICQALPEPLRDTPGLELLGFRDDISREIDGAGVVVAPYLYGSGLKIKVVEAACAGKAVVTTSSGLAGTGLTAGTALEVHDDPAPFADALAALLADGRQRARVAAAALAEATMSFSADACYGPIAFLIRLHGSDTTPAAFAGLSPAALERVRAVVEHARPARLVVWGNGAFTRALVPALAASGLHADLIVDGRAPAPTSSVEGLAVVPKASYDYAAGDLIVLASETFEADMWRDLAACREAGGHVLGLCHARFVSRGLLGRLPGPARRALHAEPPASTRTGTSPVVVLWDSGAVDRRWWRLHRLHVLAGALGARGVAVVAAVPTALAAHGAILDAFEGRGQVLPIVELDGRAIAAADVDGGARGLARAAALLTSASSEAVTRLGLAGGDVIVLLDPSLPEFLALSRLLSSRPASPAVQIVMWLSGLAVPGVADAEAAAHWRFAVHALRVAGTRLRVVTAEAGVAADLTRELELPVVVAGHAVEGSGPRDHRRPATIVCLGPVSHPAVRPMLERLAEARCAGGPLEGVTLSWRSDQHDLGTDAGRRWALDLAALLEIQLLDRADPLAVADAVAGASAVVLLAASGEAWAPAARAIAAAAGVPVLSPGSPDEAVAVVHAAIAGVGPRATGATARAVIDLLLRNAGGRADGVPEGAFPCPPSGAPDAPLAALATESRP
jgi:hypothetical protein